MANNKHENTKNDTPRHLGWHSTAQHSIAQHSLVQYSMAQYSIVQYSIVHYSIVWQGIVCYNIIYCSILQYSILQYNKVQYTILQYGMVQHSIGKNPCAEYWRTPICKKRCSRLHEIILFCVWDTCHLKMRSRGGTCSSCSFSSQKTYACIHICTGDSRGTLK